MGDVSFSAGVLRWRHVIAEILALEPLELGVLAGCEAEGGFGDFRGEYGVFALFPDAAFFPFVGEFVADGDGAHSFLDPILGVAFGLVDRKSTRLNSSHANI